MKAVKITYWVSTALLALMMVFSAYSYFTDPTVAAGFKHLGFPDYFRIELGIAKLLGAILLVLPVASAVKEWVYAGFGITFVSALLAHIALADPMPNRVAPMVFFAILILSYVTWKKKRHASVLSVEQNARPVQA